MRLERKEYYMHTARGLLGSPRRLTQGCFHPQVIDGYCIPFPRNLSTSSSSSLCSPLQSPFASAPRSTSFDASFTCLGFPPSSRHHSSAATFRAGSHACATFRPPVFSTARRFTPRPSLQAYSIPQPRPGFSVVQGLLSRRSGPSSSEGAFLLVVAASPLAGSLRFSPARAAPTCAASRLRGLFPRRAAFFRFGYSPRPKSLPSSNFSLLQVSRSLDDDLRSHSDHPLLMLHADLRSQAYSFEQVPASR